MKTEELTRKLALYQHIESGTVVVSSCFAEDYGTLYARVSEPLTVTFVPPAAGLTLTEASAELSRYRQR